MGEALSLNINKMKWWIAIAKCYVLKVVSVESLKTKDHSTLIHDWSKCWKRVWALMN